MHLWIKKYVGIVSMALLCFVIVGSSTACFPDVGTFILDDSDFVFGPCESPRTVKFQISNQSFSRDDVDIFVYINSKLVVRKMFKNVTQHDWVDYYFKICPGKTVLRTKSLKGKVDECRDIEIEETTKTITINYLYDWKLFGQNQAGFNVSVYEKEG